jgi:organic radical activating enzyme
METKIEKKPIKYKGIVHNVLNDAPFIGAIIIANQCSMNCSDCINEHLKDPCYTLEKTDEEIIKTVKENGLNQGIILSGLEWTEQPEDLLKLVETGLRYNLQVMIYTHHTEKKFFSLFPQLKNEKIYVKFGLYNEALKTDNNYFFGVKLATSNQYIKYLGRQVGIDKQCFNNYNE